MPDDATAVTGCKAAFFHAGRVLCHLRDDLPGLAWAGRRDLPGGGREGDEDPETCLLRELFEEYGLSLSGDRLIWQRQFPSMVVAGARSHFFAGHLTEADIAAIRFGDEGHDWDMMPVAAFMADPLGIPELQRRTALAWADLGSACA